MNRTEFNNAYRAARVALNTMCSPTVYCRKTRYTDCTPEERLAAEARWAVGVNGPTAVAFLAVGQSNHLSGSIATAAIHDFIHCDGDRKQWYLRMARDKRARTLAA